MKMTFQPKTRQRAKVHGFRARMSTRITRLVRESYRLHENIFNSGLDIVVVARVGAKEVGYAEIESALLHVSKLHRILITC